MKCPLCGLVFKESDGKSSCKGCMFVKSCGMVKCPNCGYELPREITTMKKKGNNNAGNEPKK